MAELEEASNRSNYSQILMDNRERLMTNFLKEVRSQMPSARNLDDKTLENSLFEFLTTIARILSLKELSDFDELFRENIKSARDHGRSRAQIPSYTLDQVIREFRILRSLIFIVLEEDGPLPSIERDKVFFAIDNGMTQASTEFAYMRGFKDARLTEEISAKNMALSQAKNLTNEKNEREKFFTAVTHDMRNPLSIARASAEFITRRPSDPDVVLKYAFKIIKNIDRSNEMIKDLLDTNRIRAGGTIALKLAECDLSNLIREACEDLAEVYGPCFVIGSLPSVKGVFDCHGIKRALENLMVNAVKYGAEDKPITVSLSLNDQDIRIQVHNEGNPISLKDQSSLFEHNFRTEEAQEGSKQGWGIGLTLVKGIAEAHHGKVEVTSSKDAGTNFTIVLPID